MIYSGVGKTLKGSSTLNTEYTPSQLLQGAYTDFRNGNVARAELLCRRAIQLGNKHPAAYDLLGLIALEIHLPSHALRYFDRAISVNPSYKPAVEHRKETLSQPQDDEVTNVSPGFLLIKAWGHGFWSDVDHVLGQLLLAEITGRTPVVHWSNASLFNDGSIENAFNLYFHELSEYTIKDLVDSGFTYYPDKWSAANLERDNHCKLFGKGSRLTALYYLNRKETVLVSDYQTFLNDLLPWAQGNRALSGMDAESVYRYLFDKYLKPRDYIKREIERFREARLHGKRCIAVHARGSDKVNEVSDLNMVNAAYYRVIEKYLDAEPSLSIFLLTDSAAIHGSYMKHYPGRIISTECIRSESREGIHRQESIDKPRAGVEVLKDVYLGAGCDYFVGNGSSNVSTTILHLKDWKPGRYTLLGENLLYVSHHLRDIY